MGYQNPPYLIVGTNVSIIQPKWVPLNVEFQMFDVEDGWHWSDKHTFIFGRQLAGSIID